jgi:hypothetical protein
MSLAMGERVAVSGIRPSVGAVGPSFDDTPAGTVNGLHKTELIKKRGRWRNVHQVEMAARRVRTGSMNGAFLKLPRPGVGRDGGRSRRSPRSSAAR